MNLRMRMRYTWRARNTPRDALKGPLRYSDCRRTRLLAWRRTSRPAKRLAAQLCFRPSIPAAANGRNHSALIAAALMSGHHFSISALW
jgi:hypothetical protein